MDKCPDYQGVRGFSVGTQIREVTIVFVVLYIDRQLCDSNLNDMLYSLAPAKIQGLMLDSVSMRGSFNLTWQV